MSYYGNSVSKKKKKTKTKNINVKTFNTIRNKNHAKAMTKNV